MWPLVLLVVRGKKHDILNEVFDKCPLAFFGLAVGVAGFIYEASGACSREQRCTRMFIAVAAGCVVLLTNALLVLGESCISLWWRGLREQWWY